MARASSQNTKAELAVALAHGVPTAQWARSFGVPNTTAYRWAKDPIVRKAVESCRRRMMDQAISTMTTRSTWAADRIAVIAREAKSDSVRLRACRAIITDTLAVSKYSGLEARLAQIETRLAEQTRLAETEREENSLNSVPPSAT